MLLPAHPVDAARAGLALYDGTLLHQRIALALGSALLNLRCHRIYRLGALPPSLLDQRWWSGWCKQVADSAIGRVGCAAFRLSEDRVIALLMTDAGQPIGFVKVWRNTARNLASMQPDVLARLRGDAQCAFRVAALLAEGTLAGWSYELFEPMPAGAHRPVEAEPARIARIFDSMHQRLASMPRRPDVPSHFVVAHGDFTPRNVRRASDGNTWILDWEYACWSPRLVDELHFWTAEFSRRVRPRPDRDGRRVAALLRQRGDDSDIAEAIRWGVYMPPGQKAIAQVVAREVGLTGVQAGA